MILALDDISERLEAIWIAEGRPPAPLDESRLRHASLERSTMLRLEETLQTLLPEEFKRLLSDYSLDNTSLLMVAFGRGNYIGELVQENTPLADPMDQQLFRWWGLGDRPAGLIAIAHGDPYTILLDCTSGTVRFYLPDECLWTAHQLLARDTHTFLRCVGTTTVARSQLGGFTVPVDEIIRESGAPESSAFWFDLAGCPADGIIKPRTLDGTGS